MEAKREWVRQLRHEAALMSAQADFHLRCDLAGYHSHHHRLLARLAQGLPLSHSDGLALVEKSKVRPPFLVVVVAASRRRWGGIIYPLF